MVRRFLPFAIGVVSIGVASMVGVSPVAPIYAQGSPVPQTESQAEQVVAAQKTVAPESTAANTPSDPFAEMDPVASDALIERLVALISDSKADPDQRARACAYLSKARAEAAVGVAAVQGFIEEELAKGKIKNFYSERPNSVIIYPVGTALRLCNAAHALGEMGPTAVEALPLLTRLTTTPIREVGMTATTRPTPRQIAAIAIGKVGQEAGMDTLISITNNDANPDARMGAVQGLGSLIRSDDIFLATKAYAQLQVVEKTDASQAIRAEAEKNLARAKQLTASRTATPSSAKPVSKK